VAAQRSTARAIDELRGALETAQDSYSHSHGQSYSLMARAGETPTASPAPHAANTAASGDTPGTPAGTDRLVRLAVVERELLDLKVRARLEAPVCTLPATPPHPDINAGSPQALLQSHGRDKLAVKEELRAVQLQLAALKADLETAGPDLAAAADADADADASGGAERALSVLARVTEEKVAELREVEEAAASVRAGRDALERERRALLEDVAALEARRGDADDQAAATAAAAAAKEAEAEAEALRRAAAAEEAHRDEMERLRGALQAAERRVLQAVLEGEEMHVRVVACEALLAATPAGRQQWLDELSRKERELEDAQRLALGAAEAPGADGEAGGSDVSRAVAADCATLLAHIAAARAKVAAATERGQPVPTTPAGAPSRASTPPPSPLAHEVQSLREQLAALRDRNHALSEETADLRGQLAAAADAAKEASDEAAADLRRHREAADCARAAAEAAAAAGEREMCALRAAADRADADAAEAVAEVAAEAEATRRRQNAELGALQEALQVSERACAATAARLAEEEAAARAREHDVRAAEEAARLAAAAHAALAGEVHTLREDVAALAQAARADAARHAAAVQALQAEAAGAAEARDAAVRRCRAVQMELAAAGAAGDGLLRQKDERLAGLAARAEQAEAARADAERRHGDAVTALVQVRVCMCLFARALSRLNPPMHCRRRPQCRRRRRRSCATCRPRGWRRPRSCGRRSRRRPTPAPRRRPRAPPRPASSRSCAGSAPRRQSSSRRRARRWLPRRRPATGCKPRCVRAATAWLRRGQPVAHRPEPLILLHPRPCTYVPVTGRRAARGPRGGHGGRGRSAGHRHRHRHRRRRRHC